MGKARLRFRASSSSHNNPEVNAFRKSDTLAKVGPYRRLSHATPRIDTHSQTVASPYRRCRNLKEPTLTIMAAPPFFSTASRPNAQIFQPPKSPASTSTSPSFTTANDYFSSGSRKRQRPDSSHSNHAQQTPWPAEEKQRYPQQTPWAVTPSWVQCPTPSDGMYGSSCAQSSALVNERYRLAGGFDTPGLMATSEQEQFARDGDLEFRRRVRDMDTLDRRSMAGGPISGPLARERNGVARMPSSPNGEQIKGGWTGLAFSLVGKVFNFGTNVIKGFYAGGGKGYDIDQRPSLSDSWMRPPLQRGHTPVPGSWRKDEFLGDFEQDNPSNSPSIAYARPPNKRRQTDKDSWVMVGTPDVADLSPKRKPSGSSVPRNSLGAARPTASRASSRRSLAPVSRRQSSFVSYTGSPAQQPPPGTQGTYANPLQKRASFAPTRSPHSRPSSAGLAAGITPEAERLLKRQVKQEKATDKTMNNMNRQLKDLIQQAQSALGTKYSVEGATGSEDLDEGFVDEEW